MNTDHERARPQLRQGCEHGVEVAFATRMQDVQLQPELARRSLGVSHQPLGKSAIDRIDEQGNAGGGRDQFVQQL
jgi:hypothetical protein